MLKKQPYWASQAHLKEIVRCRADFWHFARYTRIPTMQGVEDGGPPKVVPLAEVMKPAQRRLAEMLLRGIKNIKVLKSRQNGISTLLEIYGLWVTMFHHNARLLVVAHHEDPAKKLLGIAKFVYSHLPAFLQLPLERDNTLELAWSHTVPVEGGGTEKNESVIRALTSDSEGARSDWNSFFHASEVALWPNMQDTLNAIVAASYGPIVIETTAKGQNQFANFWWSDNGYEPFFVPWTEDPSYVSNIEPRNITAQERSYIREHELPQERAWWFCHKLRAMANHLPSFNQEYPKTPELAFISSGDRFFKSVYFRRAETSTEPGRRIYDDPLPWQVYCIGVDTASGSDDGDYNAMTVINASYAAKKQRGCVPVVAVDKERCGPIAFAKLAIELGRKYNDALLVVERNKYGVAVIDFLLEEGYPNIYVRQNLSADGVRFSANPTFGFETTEKTRYELLFRLNEYVSNGWLQTRDHRLQHEINALVFLDGKPQAPMGDYDDVLISAGLSVMGLDQTSPLELQQLQRKPRTISEILEYEQRTHKKYNPDDFEPEPYMEAMLDAAEMFAPGR